MNKKGYIAFLKPLLRQGDYRLDLAFDDIANSPVANYTEVSAWNTFFNLPANGEKFTNVEVSSNTVTLYGNGGAFCNNLRFYGNTHLVSFSDTGCFSLFGASVFHGCSGLEAFYSESATIACGEGCFRYCTALTDLIGNFITLGNNCFNGCSGLVAPDFSMVETIPDYCFLFCTGLTSPDFSSAITCGSQSFNGCTSLNTDFPNLVSAGYYCFSTAAFTNPDFSALETAGDACFRQCSNLTSSFPALITAGEACFDGCSSYTSLNFPALVTVGTNCFQFCENATTIYLPVAQTLGATVNGNNYVFYGISGKTIQLTVPAALMTCNGGNPDGDIQYLQANNTVAITQT
jgi:hypothetical protein